MKLSKTTSILFATLASASAFVPNTKQTTFSTNLQMSDFYNEDKSEALPFMERPKLLNGQFAGDVGFDPVGFVKNENDLINYREAEVKHGRLAMLAAAGWPLSELFDRRLANWLHLEPLVDANERAPSLLNGGLGKVPTIYWISCLAAAAAIDIEGYKRSQNDPTYSPGDFGWDPLGFYPGDKAGQRRMQLAEIKNGRLAMIAITAFAFQEFVQKFAVADQTPIFFKPAVDVATQYGESLGADIVGNNL